MNVIVKNLKIKNFRSCIETNVYVNPYTALVGYNNAGKSNIKRWSHLFEQLKAYL